MENGINHLLVIYWLHWNDESLTMKKYIKFWDVTWRVDSNKNVKLIKLLRREMKSPIKRFAETIFILHVSDILSTRTDSSTETLWRVAKKPELAAPLSQDIEKLFLNTQTLVELHICSYFASLRTSLIHSVLSSFEAKQNKLPIAAI